MNSNDPLYGYVEQVKWALLNAYITRYYAHIRPDQFVDTLARIFNLKQKVMINIATYVKNEVEVRGKPLDITLNNISFFAAILVEYIDRDGNQPIVKP